MVDVWPGSLPQSPLIDGYSETIGDGRRVSTTDTGPGKMYRKSSAMANPVSMNFLMTQTQLNTYLTFLHDTLLEGSKPFQIPDPRSAGTLLVRHRAGEVPTWNSPDGSLWNVQLPLEVLP